MTRPKWAGLAVAIASPILLFGFHFTWIETACVLSLGVGLNGIRPWLQRRRTRNNP